MAKRGVLARFYIRRFLRIFPLYYAVLAIAVLLHEPSTRQHLFELATYRTNFLLARLGHNLPPVTPLWSLAVEEHYYLVWPLIALFARRAMLWHAVGIMVIGSVGMRAWIAVLGGSYQAITMPTYAAVDGIALGCALALLGREPDDAVRERWLRRALVLGIILVIIRMALKMGAVPYRAIALDTLNMLPIGLVSMWLIDRATRGALPRWLGHWTLARLGVMSYGMYVFHRYVMHYLGFDRVRGLQVFASVFAVSAVLAIVSWYGFERPINNLKRFWPYVPRLPIRVPDGALGPVEAPDYAGARGAARPEQIS